MTKGQRFALYFYGYGKTFSTTFFVDGEVDSYKILTGKFCAANEKDHMTIILFICGDIFIFAGFVCSLFLSCKAYEYNGDEIVVYAGWYHHYIKINGVKTDEHNTLMYMTPILLSCTLEDGTDLQATITLTNRISLLYGNALAVQASSTKIKYNKIKNRRQKFPVGCVFIGRLRL